MHLFRLIFSYFSQWVLQLYYHYWFWTFNDSCFCKREPSCILSTCPHHSRSASLLLGTKRYSKLISYILFQSHIWNQPFLQEALLFLFSGKWSLDAKFYVLGIFISIRTSPLQGPSKWAELRNIYMYAQYVFVCGYERVYTGIFMYTHLYFHNHLYRKSQVHSGSVISVFTQFILIFVIHFLIIRNMTSIILNVFSYLIWSWHPFRAILICGCQSPPFGLCLPMSVHPHMDTIFTLLRCVTHRTVHPPPCLQGALTRHWTERWWLPSSSGHWFESPPQLLSTDRCPPSTVRCVTTILCGDTLLTLCGLCPPVPESPSGWQVVFLYYQLDHVIHLCKIFLSSLLPHSNTQTPQ